MKLSKFMKEHKKNLKKLSKKELIDQVLLLTEYNAQSSAWYLRPDSGEIIIDGQKLTDVKLTDYYRHIGYLTQEPSVFDGTIYENLTYALEDEQMEREKDREKRI